MVIYFFIGGLIIYEFFRNCKYRCRFIVIGFFRYEFWFLIFILICIVIGLGGGDNRNYSFYCCGVIFVVLFGFIGGVLDGIVFCCNILGVVIGVLCWSGFICFGSNVCLVFSWESWFL